jgi:hypothetical protein
MADDLPASLGVERRDAAVEDRELHAADAAHVAHEAVGDCADGAASACRRRQELAPWRDALRAAAAEHHDFSGCKSSTDLISSS